MHALLALGCMLGGFCTKSGTLYYYTYITIICFDVYLAHVAIMHYVFTIIMLHVLYYTMSIVYLPCATAHYSAQPENTIV